MFEDAYPEQQQTFPPPNPPTWIGDRISCKTSEPPEQLCFLHTKTDVCSRDVSARLFLTLAVNTSADNVCVQTVVFPLPGELENRVIHSGIYEDRIDYLRRMGHEEGIELNKSSEDDFYLFIKATPNARKVSLVLTDSGNLRFVWKGDEGDHIGVQFHGGGIGSYVIFKRRPSAPEISRSYGKDTLDGVRKLISVFNLQI